MDKLADEPGGWVTGRRVHKTLTDLDRRRLAGRAALGTEILGHFGAAPEDVVLGTVNAGHPGCSDPRQRRLVRRPGCPTTSAWPTPACSPSRSNPPIPPSRHGQAHRTAAHREVLLRRGSPRPCER